MNLRRSEEELVQSVADPEKIIRKRSAEPSSATIAAKHRDVCPIRREENTLKLISGTIPVLTAAGVAKEEKNQLYQEPCLKES